MVSDSRGECLCQSSEGHIDVAVAVGMGKGVGEHLLGACPRLVAEANILQQKISPFDDLE